MSTTADEENNGRQEKTCKSGFTNEYVRMNKSESRVDSSTRRNLIVLDISWEYFINDLDTR